MIKITYPGTGNYSTFSYDGLSRNAIIVETVAGSVTSTKQFVLDNGQQEERDASGALQKRFFDYGVSVSGTSYFYGLDKLGSVRTLSNASGSVLTNCAYDPYGRASITGSGSAPDFGFSRYYVHGPSGLNLTLARGYNSGLGRWNSRDPIGEEVCVNLFEYVFNEPISFVDPKGLAASPTGGSAASASGGVGGGIGGSCPGRRHKSLNPSPDFEDCAPGDVKCCDNNTTKCGQACKAIYGPRGYHPDPVLYQECVACCAGKGVACKQNAGPDKFPGAQWKPCLWASIGGYPPDGD